MRIEYFNAILLVLLLSSCVTVDPRPADPERASDVNTDLGWGYIEQGDYKTAYEKLEKALDFNPKSSSAHNAFAMLNQILKNNDKATEHYEKATSLDPMNSEAANNYGIFLCRNNEEAKSEKYFLRAIKNPLYRTPEYAYTNAALCLLRIKQRDKAISYLSKALAAKSNFPTALVAMARIRFEDQNFKQAKIYLDQYHLVARPSAKSLWLTIRTELALGSNYDVDELAAQLRKDFPHSDEYQSWLAIQ